LKTWKEIGNLYEILGLEEKAPAKKVKKGYKTKALVLHPDKNKTANASDNFLRLKKAYDILSDPIQKEQYDKYLDGQRHHAERKVTVNAERSKYMSDLEIREKAIQKKKEEEEKRKLNKEQNKREEAIRIKREMEEDAERKKEEEERRKDMNKKSKVFNSIKVKWTDQKGAEYNEDLLRIIFGKYGEVTGVAIVPGKEKAVIEFVHRLSAEKAAEENKTENKEQLGISDSLKVKLMYKDKKNKKLKTEDKPEKQDFSLNSKNLEKISHLFNRTSTSFMSSMDDDMRRKEERSRLMQEILEKEGLV